jgi:hypothetical protein
MVFMIFQPPTEVPKAIVKAQAIFTQSGTPASVDRYPELINAKVIMPMDFCASLIPWEKDIKAAESICIFENHLLTNPGVADLKHLYNNDINKYPIKNPSIGEVNNGITTFSITPLQIILSKAARMLTNPYQTAEKSVRGRNGYKPKNQVAITHTMAVNKSKRLHIPPNSRLPAR